MGVLFCFEQKSDALYQREIDEENTKRSVSKFSGSVLVLVRVQCGKQFHIVSISKVFSTPSRPQMFFSE